MSQATSLGAAGYPSTIELDMDGGNSPFANPLLEEPMLSRITLPDDELGFMPPFQPSPRKRGKRTVSSRSSPSPSGRAKRSRPAAAVYEASTVAQPPSPKNFWDLPYPLPAMLPDSLPPSMHETYFPPAIPELDDDDIDLDLGLIGDVDMDMGGSMGMEMDLDLPFEHDPDLEAHNAYLADNLSATGANPFAPGSQSPASHRSLSPFGERGGCGGEAVATAATFGFPSGAKDDMSDFEWMNRMNEGARARNSAFPRMDENLRMGRWERYARDGGGGGMEEDGGRVVAGRFVKGGFRMTREQEDIVAQMVVESSGMGYDSRQ
ncbi:uncharacterized protein C8A04DRAFT_31453 [Dichotomopilus funicola]|uniref:Uncharacterized protein n=1 Tax=Dichotomopilus funicola TaxID=1934379 RepID=A0AAN6UXI7_9PEZI|nr:hypothetical protein C8A04DRAFT_31453 [Dichotomopilus funicola]